MLAGGAKIGLEDSVRGARRSESTAGVELRVGGGEIGDVSRDLSAEGSVARRTGGGRSRRRTAQENIKT